MNTRLRRLARLSPLKTATASRHGTPILVGRGMRMIGSGRVTGDGRLELGLSFFGFADSRMHGLIRVRGNLAIDGKVRIGVGNRWDIAPGATAAIGDGTSFSPDGYLICGHKVSIGARCAISWQVQLLDSDWHSLVHEGTERQSFGPISIGDDVWIGTRATILKSTTIGDGCVVAAGAVVSGDHSEPHCLLAGVPARAIKKNVRWHQSLPGDPSLRRSDGS